jgi:hypothetical protein
VYTEFMSEKISGYLLLGLGLGLMLFSIFSVYMVFTGQSKPVDLFHLNSSSFNFSALTSALSSQYTLPNQKSATTTATPTEILPMAAINDMSNLSIHYFLFAFLAGVGYKIASLGIQLLRPIQIKLKSTETALHIDEPSPTPKP